ncbi:NAD-dependent protein deacetylase hst2-1 [Cladorrhinum sp. PSN332]|nr:NAD-dependent protein deacetylase hst2-1 [Cladorrhinum sp. PSN332]
MASPDLSLSHPSPTGAALHLAEAHSAPHPLKLYGGWFCPFVQRAWIVLVEKNIPHQYIEINPYHKSAEFLALNPRGLIPTLQVPGREKALYESMVVCEFLDEEFSNDEKLSLLPGGEGDNNGNSAYERARCRLWINHVSTRIVPAWYGVMQAQGQSGSGEREKLREGVKAFAREMLDGSNDGPWFLGERFSLVDVSLAPWAKRLWLIDYYKEGGSGIPKKGEEGRRRGGDEEEEKVWERWDQWLEAVVKRDSVVRTWSEDEKYVGVYRRYAENTTQSEVAKATRQGKGLPPNYEGNLSALSDRVSDRVDDIGRRHASGQGPRAKGRQFDDDDDGGFEDFGDDFRVQGRGTGQQAKPKKKPKKGNRNNRRARMGQEHSVVDEDTQPQTLSERSVSAVAHLITSGKARRIVVMTGAGISTAAGIPDFRSPDTGLYANLASLDLPEPEAVFDLSFFKENPRPFYVLAKELYPGTYHPTISHAFISLLASKNLLHQLFTQNIDCLERAAGIPEDLIIEAHGSFATQRCVECKTPYDDEKMRDHVRRGDVPRCEAKQDDIDCVCGGLVKPDIVFFGEQLPKAFFDRISKAEETDLVLVLGTSLQVHPFASLPNLAAKHVPRVLFNMERVGSMGSQADDVLVLGECDAGVRKLADALGWRDELEKKWRELVGDDEAERQLQGGKKRVEALHDEVVKWTEEVDDVLQSNEDNEERTDDKTDEKLSDALRGLELDPKKAAPTFGISKSVTVEVEEEKGVDAQDSSKDKPSL